MCVLVNCICTKKEAVRLRLIKAYEPIFRFIAWNTMNYNETNKWKWFYLAHLFMTVNLYSIYILYARWAEIDWNNWNQIWNICNETKLPKSRMQSSTTLKTNNNFVQLFWTAHSRRVLDKTYHIKQITMNPYRFIAKTHQKRSRLCIYSMKNNFYNFNIEHKQMWYF